MVSFTVVLVGCLSGVFVIADVPTSNLIPNGDFRQGHIGDLPDGWSVVSARNSLAPAFELTEISGERFLMAYGKNNPDCVGYVHTTAPIERGKTYQFEVLFKKSDCLNPHEHLLFQAFLTSQKGGPRVKDGIFEFQRLENGLIVGQEKICYPGEGKAEADIRILFRLNAEGKAWIKNISLCETDPVSPRWVKVACTSGKTNLDSCRDILETAGKHSVDMVLLPEFANGMKPETLSNSSVATLMSRMAQKYNMYAAGGIVRLDKEAGRHYNTALLYDRHGKLIGMYDKVHPYSPELNEEGITPGKTVPVFKTDFGKIGIMICYDSWFTDVAELLSLKGAEIILFPNAGHQPEFLYARAGDNAVRIINSSLNLNYSIHDTLGRNILKPDAFETSESPNMKTFKDIKEIDLGKVKMLVASLDLNCSPSPAYNGGTMMSAPGNRRNRREQKNFLEDEIKRQRQRWWVK